MCKPDLQYRIYYSPNFQVVSTFLLYWLFFLHQEIPEPISHIISHWGDDTYTRMAYSYVKVGSSGQDLDTIATEVDNKLYFAGEVIRINIESVYTGYVCYSVLEPCNLLEKIP